MTLLSSGLYQSYMDANRMVLFVVGCIALISLIPVLCISEKKSDYQMELTPRLSLKEKNEWCKTTFIKSIFPRLFIVLGFDFFLRWAYLHRTIRYI